MNSFVFATAFVLLVAAFVQAEDAKKPNEKLAETFKKCRETWPVTDEEVEQVKNKESFPESKNAKCILACMLKEGKVLQDGKYNKDNALLMADVLHKDEPEIAEKHKQIIEICSVEVGTDIQGDECDFAHKMGLCTLKHAKEMGVTTPEF